LQTQLDGFVQTSPELSPGMQIGGWAASHVTLHFGHGGGPSTLQEDGLVMSQAGVAVGAGVAPDLADLAAWAFDLVFSPPTAAIGKITHAMNKIVTASILFFIDYLCRFQFAGAPKPVASRRTLSQKGAIIPHRKDRRKIRQDIASITTNGR